jgi:DNA-binding transcriptional regulator YhcF (GntR family)
MLKYQKVADLIEKRIQYGDYTIKDIPTERELALQAGVSRITTRKAIQVLLDRKVLVRRSNGQLEINRQTDNQNRLLQLAFLEPAFHSLYNDLWRLPVEIVANKMRATVRPIDYVHWDDSSILEALNNFDGVFLLPIAEDFSPEIINTLRKSPAPLVVFDNDLTEYGIPSAFLFPPVYCQQLLDHLDALGHRHIDCLNTQPKEQICIQRIEQWNLWRARHGYQGRLFDEPVKSYGFSWIQAYEVMGRLLDSGEFKASALFCTTQAVAIGAMRAMYERGLKVGKDISVCAANDDGTCQYLCPSITCLKRPDVTPYITICMEWMARGGKNWVGPLLLKSSEDPVYIGETTGPVLKKT